MREFRILALIVGLGLGSMAPSLVMADHGENNVNVSCTSPPATAPVDGGTVLVDVNCLIDAPNASSNYRITGSADNLMTPNTTFLNKNLSVLSATRQPNVNSPDGSVTSISGTSNGFTAQLTTSSSPKTLRFQYQVTTTNHTPAGTYTSLLNPPAYRYQICTTPSCSQQSFSGIAIAPLSITIPSAPVTVNCASSPINAAPGGGTFDLDIVCTVSGGNPASFSPSGQNTFSPATVTLSNGSTNLTATLQSAVTSPDGSVSGLVGTASEGFTGNINTIPAKVQARYTGTTLNTTPAGTYTSAPVLFTWSTI